MARSAASAAPSSPLRAASLARLSAAISASEVAEVGAIENGPATGRASGLSVARLAKMARIFARECGGDYAFSLDGNESFRAVGAFAEYARGLMADTALMELWPRLLFIEQPWHRDVALSDAIGELTRAWPERPPIIIDESDAELSSLPRALELGYAGTSHKNCKGVFKGIANACLLAQRRARGAAA